jgi:hypothetical protein
MRILPPRFGTPACALQALARGEGKVRRICNLGLMVPVVDIVLTRRWSGMAFK